MAKRKVIAEVATVSTNYSRPCPDCNKLLDVGLQGENFSECCNHLLRHGFEFLHAGTQTIRLDTGELFQTLVAVFGAREEDE